MHSGAVTNATAPDPDDEDLPPAARIEPDEDVPDPAYDRANDQVDPACEGTGAHYAEDPDAALDVE